MPTERQHELELLEALEDEPETTQADLASQAGVAVGTVNWYLKRWASKGYVKIKRIGRWRWKYLLTPQGMAAKARLASEFMEASMALYRRTRTQSKTLVDEVTSRGYKEVTISGDGDMADIIRLTCLEKGVTTVPESEADSTLPVIAVVGRDLEVSWPE